MKIVYISSSTIPSRAANSIHVMKMCQAFAKNGHEVVLLAPDIKAGIEPDVKDLYVYYGVDKCFQIIKLPFLNFKGGNFLYGIWAAVKARMLSPDLVFGRNITGCFFSAQMNMQTAFESHTPNESSSRLITKFKSWMFQAMIGKKNFKLLVVITDSLKQHYIDRHSSLENKITVAPDGADPVTELLVPAKLNQEPDRLQVGYVGHLFNGRGVEIVIAMALNCHWADFHLVGGMPKDIAYWREETRSVQNILFHGFVAPVEAERLRIAFDILLAPYQNSVAVMGGTGDTSRWMSPLKIFEYMAAKKPIICSDLPVLREVLNHNYNALLCKPDNVEEWVCALVRLRDEKFLAQRLAVQAHQDFLEHYTWKSRAKKILEEMTASSSKIR